MKKFLPILLVSLFLLVPQVFAASSLNDINQKVCDRFEEDISRMAGIMEEVRDRKGITETRVAFGGIDDAIKSGDYQITYAAEAIAFQRYQKPSSATQLKSSLGVLRRKILNAKTVVGRAL